MSEGERPPSGTAVALVALLGLQAAAATSALAAAAAHVATSSGHTWHVVVWFALCTLLIDVAFAFAVRRRAPLWLLVAGQAPWLLLGFTKLTQPIGVALLTCAIAALVLAVGARHDVRVARAS